MERVFKWVVVGAGPGGLCVLGNLLSSNEIKEEDVLWVDPVFQSGNLYNVAEVPSNTKVNLFLKFFEKCPYLSIQMNQIMESSKEDPFKSMHSLEQEKGCFLNYAKDAVIAVTDQILKKVPYVRGMVTNVTKDSQKENEWILTITDNQNKISTFRSNKVAFSTGSYARNLDLHSTSKFIQNNQKIEMISLQDSFSPSKLKSLVNKDDVVAVFGTSHSGILVLRNLATVLPDDHGIKVKNIKAFSKYPLLYAEYMDGWIKNDNTGLKLVAAEWAREHYDKNPHQLIEKIAVGENEHEVYERHLPECTKVIYAVGYNRSSLPNITINNEKIDSDSITYNSTNGQIQVEKGGKFEFIQGLFGFGIAFPELKTYPDGKQEFSVGMWKFMDFGIRTIPNWIKQ